MASVPMTRILAGTDVDADTESPSIEKATSDQIIANSRNDLAPGFDENDEFDPNSDPNINESNVNHGGGDGQIQSQAFPN